jgi:Cd2+/Zn2+-exporting ATPase
MTATKKYILENLCCENCAAAIEREVRQLSGVKNAVIDVPNTFITVEFDGDEAGIKKSVTEIAVDIDEDIVIKEG